MDKVHREASSVRVAFEAAMKRKSSTMEQAVKQSSDAMAEGNASKAPPPPVNIRNQSKRFLRPFVAVLFKLLRPIAAPIAFRTRRYLLDGLRQELLLAIGDLHPRLDRIENELEKTSPQIGRIEEFTSPSNRHVAVNCGPDDILIKTAVGYVLCASADPALIEILLEAGELERGTRVLIERLVRSGDTFVDVGANIGLHTLAAARTMRGSGRIVSFEPYQPTVRRLEKTIWFNGFSSIVDVHQCAVSDRQGVQKLHLGPTSGHHSLFDLGAEEGIGGSPVEVRLVTIDETVGPDAHVDLIKIDAEGAELSVLRGALKTIQANPEIGLIVEFGPSHLERIGQTAESWLAAFTDLGLQYRAIHHLNGTLAPISLEELKAIETVNLLFARPQSRVWKRD